MRQFTAQLTTKKIQPMETVVQENWGCRKKWCSWFFFKRILESNFSIWQYCHTWVVTSPRFTSQQFCAILSNNNKKKPFAFSDKITWKPLKHLIYFENTRCSSFLKYICRKKALWEGEALWRMRKQDDEAPLT